MACSKATFTFNEHLLVNVTNYTKKISIYSTFGRKRVGRIVVLQQKQDWIIHNAAAGFVVHVDRQAERVADPGCKRNVDDSMPANSPYLRNFFYVPRPLPLTSVVTHAHCSSCICLELYLSIRSSVSCLVCYIFSSVSALFPSPFHFRLPSFRMWIISFLPLCSLCDHGAVWAIVQARKEITMISTTNTSISTTLATNFQAR